MRSVVGLVFLAGDKSFLPLANPAIILLT